MSAIALLNAFQETWPARLRVDTRDRPPVVPATHPLAGEVRALLMGQTCSLPLQDKSAVDWYTLAPDANALRGAVDTLQAWVLPSFAWEHPQRAYVVDEDFDTVCTIAREAGLPAIYRWRSSVPETWSRVAEKLRQARRLEALRPAEPVERTPLLVELRRNYSSAMAASDRAGAESAVRAMEEHQLETPANVRFLWYRLWDHFAEHRLIVDDESLDRLLRQQVPQRVALAVARAFHGVFLAPHEEQEDLEAAVRAFSDHVSGRLAGLLPSMRVEQGAEITRLLAYRCRSLGRFGADALPGSEADAWSLAILSPPAAAPPQPADVVALADDQLFFTAAARRDWPSVQDLGLRLLSADAEMVVPVLRRSLEFHDNKAVRDALRPYAAASDAPPDAAEPAKVPPVTSWSQWLVRLRQGDYDGAKLFLFSDGDRASTDFASDSERVLQALDDVYTDHARLGDATFSRHLNSGLAELAADLAHDPMFPRRELADLYLSLMRLWAHLNNGSAVALDFNVLLTFGDAALSLRADAQGEVAGMIETWWNRRPALALLPLLIDGLEMLQRLAADPSICETMWFAAGDLLRRERRNIARSDQSLWRWLGQKIGLKQEDIDELIPPPTAADASIAEDPVATAKLRKVALLWRRVESAPAAAQRLAERSGAEVVAVTEEHGGQIRSALNADVILIVWKNISHSVFRALDSVDRRKFAYVAGEGISSIERALERWVLQHVLPRK